MATRGGPPANSLEFLPDAHRGRGNETERRAQRVALISQASSSSSLASRERALRALADAAMCFDGERRGVATLYDAREASEMFAEASEVLVLGASGSATAGMREEALRAMGALAYDTSVSQAMWNDVAGVRAALLAAAAAEQPEACRFESHRALSVLAGNGALAAAVWADPATRVAVLAAVCPSLADNAAYNADHPPPTMRVRAEAFDTLINAVSRRGGRAPPVALARQLWHDAPDVRLAVSTVCADADEPDRVRLKALQYVARVLHAGGGETIGFTWTDDVVVQSVLGCATASEPSASQVRLAALSLLCTLLNEHGQPATAQHAAVMAALLRAVDGEYAIFEGELRVRCSLEHDRLDLLDSTRHVGLPLRERPRYAGLGLTERLAKLRAIWQRRNGKSIQIQVRRPQLPHYYPVEDQHHLPLPHYCPVEDQHYLPLTPLPPRATHHLPLNPLPPRATHRSLTRPPHSAPAPCSLIGAPRVHV